MSSSFKNTAYGIMQNRQNEQGDDSCDELLIDIEEQAEAVVKSNSEIMIHENLSEDKYSEGYCQNSELFLPRRNYDAQGINDFSKLYYENEISDKFSKMNTSSRIFDSYALSPNTCHSDFVEVLEQKSQYVFGKKKKNFKPHPHERPIASQCFENHGLFHVSGTPDDFCTKFKTLIGSNEKLLTLDNVGDIKFKSKDFRDSNCHGFAKNEKYRQFSKSKDILDMNFVKSDTKVSSNSVTFGETSGKYKATNFEFHPNAVFTKNTSVEKHKIKVGLKKPNKSSNEKLVFIFAEDVNAKTSNVTSFEPKTQIESAPKGPKLKHRRISLPCMQGSVNDLDTFQFDQRNSISFGLPNPTKFSNCINMRYSKQSTKRLASFPIKNMSDTVWPPATSSTKRRTDNQPDEPSSKLRKRCLSSTDVEAGDNVDMRHRVRSSSDGENRESVSNESSRVSSSHKRVVDDGLTGATCESQHTSKKLRQNNNLNPMQ